MTVDLSRIETEVAEAGTVMDGVAILIAGIQAEIKTLRDELAGQPAIQAKLDELAAALDARTNALTAATVEGTVAEDEVPPVEPPA